MIKMNIAAQFSSLAMMCGRRFLDLCQSINLSTLFVAKMKMTNPLRLTRQNELCSPSVGLSFTLRTGEAVNIGSMLRQQDEIMEVMHDQACFIVSPDRRSHL